MKNCKEIDYYNSLIEKLTEINRENKLKLGKGLINSKNLTLRKMSWFLRDIKILISHYSSNNEKEKLRELYSILIKDIGNVWKKEVVKLKDSKGNDLGVYILEPYIFMRWMLSLGVLLDVPNNEFNILVDLIKRDEINDKLYDFLISSRIEDWKISDSMSLKKPENSIQEIIDIQDNTECEKNIKEYLNKEWYKTYKYAGFYNSHTKPEDMFLFYGYWAFEVAALAKIKGLDDSSFRTNKYYPNTLL